MNASQEFKLHQMYLIYKHVEDIKDEMAKTEESYNEWIKMTPHQLAHEVMKRSGGHFNPRIVMQCVSI
jgi:hypothetical protein